MRVLRRIQDRLQTAVLERPHAVIAATLLSVSVALALGATVELRKSRSELAPPDDPDQRRWSALLEEYRGSEMLIACVGFAPGVTGEPAGLRAHADRLAAAF